MKKSVVILAGVLLLAGAFMQVRAQAPFAGYKTGVSTEAYHSLGNGATVLWEPTATDTLNHKMLLSASERIILSASEVANYPANIALGNQMPFGLKKFSSLAMTADGYVFFGSRLKEGDAADSVLAVANSAANLDVASMVSVEPGKCEYFFYSGFLTENTQATPKYIAAWLVGGQNAKIGYEIADGVLYIGYENILICGPKGNSATVSWNYRLELASGNIALQIKDFSNAEADKYRYLFGLFGSEKDINTFDAVWLKDWAGATANVAWEDNAFSTTDNEPADKTISFTVPAVCQKITDFTVTWNGNPTATDNTVNIGSAVDWNRGNKALFVLSREQTLSGDNLPVDGTLYIDGDKIGTGEVRVGTKDNLGVDMDGLFENLESSTTYYCHVFGYSDTCSGLIYSDPQTQTVTTLMGAPQTDVITMGRVTDSSFMMTLAAPVASGLSYVVAVSKNPLADEDGNLSVELTNGTTYAEGQTVDGATIKKVGVGAGEITIDKLDPATPYYVAVWHMQGTGSSVEYSLKYTTVGQRTVTKIPVTIDFADELTESQPRGWTISKDEAGVYGFKVSSYGDDDPGIALRSPMAKAPQADSKVLVSQLVYNPEDAEDVLPATKVVSAYAISPVFDTASFPGVTGIFKMGFLSMDTWGGFAGAYTLQGSDSVVISWAANQTENWNRVAKIDRTTKFDEDGFTTITTASIRPNGYFRYKVEVFRTLNKHEPTTEAFIIESLEMEEDLPCKYPTDIEVVESDLYATSAKLRWEDANLPATPSFKISYQVQGEEEWNTETTGEVEYLLNNLTPTTAYDVRIQAVCGEADSSLVKTISFTTYGVIPYIWDAEALIEDPDVEPEFPAEMKVYRGALDATLQLGAGWALSSDRSGYPMLNLPLATEANTWLMLPTLISENNADLTVTVNLANWGLKTIDYEQVFMDPQSHDTLWLFISETGSFAQADRRVAGFVALQDLLYAVDSTEEEGFKSYRQRFNEKTFEFEVESGKKYSLAFFIPGIESDINALDPASNNISINKISVEYGAVTFPALTDIYTYDLGKTSVSVAWQSQADSNVLIYKPRSEQKFDTVGTKENHIDLTDLQSGTRYEFYVYGIYDGVAGKKSAQQFFSTLAECETPTDFAIVQTLWDGARITGKSKNNRFVHIKSEGEITDYYVNTVLAWTFSGDTLRLRGLYISGVNYPFSVRLRSVCGPGDSSAWTEPLIFRTAEYPEIGTPTNLRATFDGLERTATLRWTPGVNNDFMYIYYRKAGDKNYDTTGTEASFYTLRNLETNVVYKWVLQPLHDMYLLGEKTEEGEFGSNVGNENKAYADVLRVRVTDRRIIVDNPENRYIKTINVYDMAGRRLKSYPVNDEGNVFVNTDLKQGVVLIEVIGSANERMVAKTVIM